MTNIVAPQCSVNKIAASKCNVTKIVAPRSNVTKIVTPRCNVTKIPLAKRAGTGASLATSRNAVFGFTIRDLRI